MRRLLVLTAANFAKYVLPWIILFAILGVGIFSGPTMFRMIDRMNEATERMRDAQRERVRRGVFDLVNMRGGTLE